MKNVPKPSRTKLPVLNPAHVHKKIKSPVGLLTLVADDRHLLGILWQDENPSRIKAALGQAVKSHPILDLTQSQLEEFFAGSRKHFDLPIRFIGTDFQVKVWRALQRIPFAETRSYSDLARELGSPKSCRAVGAANGKNPISVIVPCHRVIGKNGTLTGFAGGLKNKKYLLDHEQSAPNNSHNFSTMRVNEELRITRPT